MGNFFYSFFAVSLLKSQMFNYIGKLFNVYLFHFPLFWQRHNSSTLLEASHDPCSTQT